MSTPPDLSRVLGDWPYDPDSDVRLVIGADGRELIQVRTPLGIEQMETAGRPDRARPYGLESVLEYYTQRLARAQAANRHFTLDETECAELFQEGTLYYLRYLRFFQLQRWVETVRDTARNLRLFDFVRDHAAREDDRQHLEKWRPYILRMNACASALMTLDKGAVNKSLEILEAAATTINELPEVEDETFQFERGRSLAAIRDLHAQIEQNRPVTPLERLERQLQSAIERQEFERAAKLRDRIRELRAE